MEFNVCPHFRKIKTLANSILHKPKEVQIAERNTVADKITQCVYPVDKERKAATGATFYVSLLFFMGVFFGYFVVTPISINFLSNYQIDPSILNEFDIISYVSTVTTLVLACALLFQLPIVVYFATKAGLVSSSLLKTYRKHSIIVILMLSAVLTPPDPFSQVLIAIPLGLLYQLSILIAVKLEKKERKQELTKP